MEYIGNLITSSIQSLPEQFTTHKLIIHVAKNHQHEYIDALQRHIHTERPFQTLHSKIGKFLSESTGLVELIKDDEKDADIFGQVSSNALWKKTVNQELYK